MAKDLMEDGAYFGTMVYKGDDGMVSGVSPYHVPFSQHMNLLNKPNSSVVSSIFQQYLSFCFGDCAANVRNPT
jgi:hypothetical protein